MLDCASKAGSRLGSSWGKGDSLKFGELSMGWKLEKRANVLLVFSHQTALSTKLSRSRDGPASTWIRYEGTASTASPQSSHKHPQSAIGVYRADALEIRLWLEKVDHPVPDVGLGNAAGETRYRCHKICKS